MSNEDDLLLVLSADHVIQDNAAFTKAVADAIPLAESGKLVTFGIVADKPHTGYGYIKRGVEQGVGFVVERFVEKPSIEVAQGYIDSGEYYWNSGMFLVKAGRYLAELTKFRPDIYEACRSSIAEMKTDLDFVRIDSEKFKECPEDSIDYAVMEKTSDAVVVPLDAGWSDIGSWSSLWEISKKDCSGNVAVGDVKLFDTSNSYVRTDGKLVATIGVENLVIVSTKDAVLVADKDQVQNAKELVLQLKSDSRPEWKMHREVYRPWGKYDSIDLGERYQVKRLP